MTAEVTQALLAGDSAKLAKLATTLGEEDLNLLQDMITDKLGVDPQNNNNNSRIPPPSWNDDYEKEPSPEYAASPESDHAPKKNRDFSAAFKDEKRDINNFSAEVAATPMVPLNSDDFLSKFRINDEDLMIDEEDKLLKQKQELEKMIKEATAKKKQEKSPKKKKKDKKEKKKKKDKKRDRYGIFF